VSGHAHHEALPGYSPGQILHDGCPVCESREGLLAVAMSHFDRATFTRAWKRAAQTISPGGLPDESDAEAWLLNDLAAVQVQLKLHCGLPLGELPGGAS
jgi:hypothetical protein